VVLSFLKGVGSAKASLVIQVGYACVFETLLLVIKPRQPFNKVILTDGIPVLWYIQWWSSIMIWLLQIISDLS